MNFNKNQSVKTKTIALLSLFFILMAFMITPLRVHATEDVGKEENSQTEIDQAAKASSSEAPAGASSGLADDNAGQAGASAVGPENQKAGPGVREFLDENYLIQKSDEAQEALTHLTEEKKLLLIKEYHLSCKTS